jgi:predicted permease
MVLIAALPPVFAGMILAVRYRAYVETASSSLIFSALLFAAAAPMWVAIARSFSN